MSNRKRLDAYRTLLQSMQDLRQELTAKEISLQEMRGSHSISSAQFRKRCQKIAAMKHHLKYMQEQVHCEINLYKNARSLELPDLQNCRLMERSVIEGYFNETFKVVHDTYCILTNFLSWVDDAFNRRKRFLAIFRLARIKHFMGRLKTEQKKLRLDIQLQEKLLDQLISILGHKKNDLPITVQAANIFAYEESLHQKISQLEQKIQRKKQEIFHMKDWLKLSRTKIRARPPLGNPNTEDLAALTRKLNIYEADKLNRSRERVSLAEAYISSYIKKFAYWDDHSPRGRDHGH